MSNFVTLFVTPVNRVSPQGRDRQTYNYIDPNTNQLVIGKVMKKPRPDGTKVRLMFQPDYNTGKYNTGLDEVVINPYYGQEGYNIPEQISKLDKITLQQLYEVEHSLPTGSLNSNITSSIFNTNVKKLADDDTSIIPSFFVDLYPRSNRFDNNTLRGKLAILLLKNHAKVAKNKNETNNAIHYFYISQENEDLEEAMTKQDLIDNVTHAKVELLKSTSDFKLYQIASLCTLKNGSPIIQGNVNPTQIKAQLNNYLDTNSSSFKYNAQTFLNLIELNSKKTEKQRMFVKYLMQQAINTKVFDIRDGFVFWTSKAAHKNMYKHSDILKLENLLLSEMLVFNPEEVNVTNWFNELKIELITKNVKIE